MGATPDELRDQIEATRAGLSSTVDTLADRVSPSAVAHRKADQVRGAFGSARDAVMGKAHDASGRLPQTAGSVRDSASDTGGSVSDAVSGAPAAVRSRAQGSPLAAGLIAFGAGMLLSALIPASQAEQQAALTVKDKAGPLVEEAKTQAQQAKDALQPAAQDAVAQVKDAATDAVATTKGQASDAAGEVADHAKTAANDTKIDLTEHAQQAREDIRS